MKRHSPDPGSTRGRRSRKRLSAGEPLSIEDHGVIGDLHTAALVGVDGSIDFMCFPRFDSPTVFAAILDDKRGGRFSIAPVIEVEKHRQFYLPDTNVLLTRFLSRDGVAELSDFMPVEEASAVAHNLVRRVKTIRGEMRYRVVCEPRFDYGRAHHKVHRIKGGMIFESQGSDGLVLRLRASDPVKLEAKNGSAVAEFTLRAGHHAAFVLEQVEKTAAPSDSEDFVIDSFKQTVNFWRNWIGQSSYRGRWREMVNRAALVLKLLTSQQFGSIVAAPTFGLPERIGGERNWDYRYTWIRDASLTLNAFMRLGFFDEARDFFRWLESITRDRADGKALQVMYGIDGRSNLSENNLTHLSGYRGSKPVRIGNAAHEQLQLDMYGELMDAVYHYNRKAEPVHHAFWEDLVALVEFVAENWRSKDKGIWEERGRARHFLHSRVMCWTALDRAIRLGNDRAWPAPLDDWKSVRDAIYEDVFQNFFAPGRKAFVQHAETKKSMDASALVMPLAGIISPSDPLWLSTLRAVEKDLVEDSLVYRYRIEERADEPLEQEDGSFSICTFWYVEALSRLGDLEKARFVFEKMLAHSNHLGLYAEELGPCGEHLGNFPQAFTHLALISAACDLDARLSQTGHDGDPRSGWKAFNDDGPVERVD